MRYVTKTSVKINNNLNKKKKEERILFCSGLSFLVIYNSWVVKSSGAIYREFTEIIISEVSQSNVLVQILAKCVPVYLLCSTTQQ